MQMQLTLAYKQQVPVLSSVTEQERLENLQQKEHDLLATPNITGSRASGQGLDLGRTKKVGLTQCTIKCFKCLKSGDLGTLVRGQDRQSKPRPSAQSSHLSFGEF